MKKMLALVLCCIFVFTPITSAVAVKAETDEPMEGILGFLEENIAVTDHGNGMVQYTLSPAMAHITASELVQAAGVSVAQAPVYNAGAVADYDYTTGQKHTAITLEQRYLYSLLDDEWKARYRALDEAVREFETSVKFEGLKSSDLTDSRLYFLYMIDNPELVCLGNTVMQSSYIQGFKYSSGYIFCYAVSATDYYFDYGASEKSPDDVKDFFKRVKARQATFDKAVQDFVETIPANAPAVVKERLIAAKILLNAYYNLQAQWGGYLEDNWNAYGVLCNGYGVCESYSEAFQTLCNAVGIECTAVVGDAGGPHKWNAVKVEGEWYQCDVTFDDPIGGEADVAYCRYFNLTDEQMKKDHDWSTCDFTVPVCNATKYGRDNFVILFGDDKNGKTHHFDNVCDGTCNNCEYTRSVKGHEMENGVCKYCGYGATQGWRQEDGNWYFYRDDKRVTNERIEDVNGARYVGADGALITSAHIYDKEGQLLGYVDENGYVVKNVWHTHDGKQYYLDDNGKIATNQWIEDANGSRYVGADGALVTASFIYDENGQEVCYVDANGHVVKNAWCLSDGKWYYLDANSQKVADKWMKDSKGWVKLGADGAMLTNKWTTDSKGWCFVGADGYAVTNCWKKDSTGWIWLNANGSMTKSKWVQDGGKWYYLNAKGYMSVNKWEKDSKGWVKLGADGAMLINKWTTDSKGWCFVGADGYAVTLCWKKDSTGWIYLDKEGSMTKAQWVKDGGKWYYCDAKGYMVAGKSMKIGNKTYKFNASGVCTNP